MWVRLSPIMPCREPFYQLWGKSAYKVDMRSWVNPIPAVVYPIEAVMLYLPMSTIWSLLFSPAAGKSSRAS